jgi:hypothetical protein
LKGEVSGLQVQGWSLNLVGIITDFTCWEWEGACDIMVQDEVATQADGSYRSDFEQSLMTSICYLPVMISWRQKHNMSQGLLEDCA